MFQCATQNTVGITFFYMSDEEVTTHIKLYELEQRYSRCSTVSGTRSHHCFIPQSKSTLVMKGFHQMKKELKRNFSVMIMLLQFGHMSSYIKIYNLENMLLACIRVCGTLVLQLNDRIKTRMFISSS